MGLLATAASWLAGLAKSAFLGNVTRVATRYVARGLRYLGNVISGALERAGFPRGAVYVRRATRFLVWLAPELVRVVTDIFGSLREAHFEQRQAYVDEADVTVSDGYYQERGLISIVDPYY